MITDAEKELDEMAQDLYESSSRQFRPAFPWIFCRVLPKTQKVGSIITPGTQNKTIHEGIVLATWRSSPALFYNVNKSQWEAPERFVSELVPGDHVIFPHWSGMPIPGFDTGSYRLVKEANWALDKEGGIIGVLDGEHHEEQTITEMIRDILRNDNHTAAEIAAKISERFVLVDRNRQSATLSGV